MEENFLVTQGWREAYRGASVGVLVVRNVTNPREHPELETRKFALVRELRDKFATYDREAFKAHSVLAAYREYYRGFKKTYHVQHQLESVVHKGKAIPKVASLVEAMFMAELKNLLLTAGHDMDQVAPPVTIDITQGDESFVRLNGQEQLIKAGDMMIGDQQGILSCIIYGPARRAQIRPETTRALFTVYAPEGIERGLVKKHLEDIRDNVRVVAPGAKEELIQVFTAD